MKRSLLSFIARVLPAVVLLLSVQTNRAGSATWKLNPVNADWNNASNWTPSTIPNSSVDTATFDSSNETNVALSAITSVDSIVFNSGASAFTIAGTNSTDLTIHGVGITNNSGITQNFFIPDSGGGIAFGEPKAPLSHATAGNLTAFTNNGGIISFSSAASAGNGTFTNKGGAVSGAFGGRTLFENSSTAGKAIFTNNGSAVSGAVGGFMQFSGRATAGNATFTFNGGIGTGARGGLVEFLSFSKGGNAKLIANGGSSGAGGGTILLWEASTGGTARVEVFGNGNLDISGHYAPGVTVGSIEGDGKVFLGSNNLTVGGNNLSTTFSGKIQNGGIHSGSGGSVTKIGAAKLVLKSANTYSGGTTINAGRLVVNNPSGSGTGPSAVQINGGTLGGTGTIAGAVTVGDATTAGAILLPGKSATSPGILTTNSMLTFNSLSTYKCVLNRTSGKASTVAALGVTINSGVPFTFVDTGTGTLTVGTVFTVINNTSATPIADTFSNLANGSTFTSNGNNFQASYTGGTGNDLTLTVVP